MAADAVNDRGYTNLMIFQGGMPEWLGKGYPVVQGTKPGKRR